MNRRAFLSTTLLGGLAAATWATPAWAKARTESDARIRGIDAGARGFTFDLAPRSAPYPFPGGTFSDPTVLAFVPRHLRASASGALDVVVFFHGHGTTAREAIVRHQLREQLAESRQNAVLVVPQGPVHASLGDFGRLMRPGGLPRMLEEVRGLLASAPATRALGDAACTSKRVGRLIVAAHSGGYRAAAAAVSVSKADVREAWLFDALYGEAETFRDWLLAAPDARKLVSFAIGGVPLRSSLTLCAALRARGVTVLEDTPTSRLSRADMVRAHAILARPAATHGTAVAEESSLRDCLLASCFRGRGSDGFFEDAEQPRAIARRNT